MPIRRIPLGLAILSFVLAAPATHANWGHWRGEGGNGVSTKATPPTEWSDTQNVKWKVPIPGRGSGSPVVWGNRIYVTTAVAPNGATDTNGQSRQELEYVLMCIDRETGDTVWQQSAATGRPYGGTHNTNSFASASPCTDGQHVYAHFGSQGLFCYTMDGQPVWERDFGDMRTRNGFGEGSSPTIEGEKILVPWDHEGESFLYALNKLTGDNLWRTPRDEPTCWATPLVIEHNGAKQVVMNGQTCARAYDLESGKELWRCGGQTQRPVASAVASDGRVFVGSGHRGSFLAAFDPGGSGDIRGTDSVVWSVSRDTPDIASPLLSDGRLYYYKGKSGLLTCVDAATGKPHYSTQRTGLRNIYASPVAAGGYLFLTDRDGTTVVIKDSDQFEIVAENSVGETVDATPAPVDNQLIIRGERNLFCIE
ncbi:PQQ-binding-like beta-propeller repeat protein [Aeoliella sp.]|uniref:outer membrane protein assembly factor BamB family protein n=1 Tax=Aeoliella sp. TaxID=2795800 RepID=UPI003CCBE98C